MNLLNPFTKRSLAFASIALFCATIFLLATNSSSAYPEKYDSNVLDRAIVAIHKHYIDPKRIDPKKMLSESLEMLQKGIPEILVKENGNDFIVVTVGLAKKRFKIRPMRNLQQLDEVMIQLMDFIFLNYEGDIKPEEIERVAINGMLNALDPHSNFLSKKVYNEFKIGTRGKFGGLGIVITMKDGMLTVIAPIEGTPAYRHGIKSGDKIVQIGDESTINMSLTDAVNKLRGKVGKKVRIIVEREGRPSRSITLTRALINIDSVKYGMLPSTKKKIGYIGIKSFQSNTYKDTKAAIKSIHDQNNGKLDGLVLDLRNNPGGLLSSSVSIADLFIKKGVIVSTVGKGGDILDKDEAHLGGTEPDYPVIVLINEGSASASEIVAGSLQAHNRAVVMGSESFGKGSVQTIFELGNDTALKLTIAKYKPAGTESIQLIGVMPDIHLIPVIVDKEEINLYPDKFFSEKDFDEHLERSKEFKKSKFKQPKYTVRYLKPKEGEEEIEERSKREYSKKIDVADDFAVKLSQKIIEDNSKDSLRSAVLSSSKPVVEKATAAEQTKIDSALGKLGIDWKLAKSTGAPKLKLTQKILQNGKPTKQAEAGEKVEIELTAKNIGTGNYSRLLAIGQSEDFAFLANREFPFGLLKAGQSKSWKVPIELPKSLATQDLPMELTFEEANEKAPPEMKIGIPVKELPEPIFSMSYSVPKATYGKAFKSSPIAMDIKVENKGIGTSSEDTIISLSGECDDKVFIEKGRIKIGELKAKQKTSTKLKFHMLPGFDESNCSIDLTLADIKRRLFITKRIKLYPTKGTMLPEPGTTLSPPKISFNNIQTKVHGGSAQVSGTIIDNDKIRDYFIFVDEKKIDYKTNPKGSSSMNFNMTIPLKPGSNSIIIGSRDEEKITGTKTLVIERLN
ncbi:MAG: PDZ domain-containing protein [Deltaproteobacteria bacterium]|nr:PDZ domain-containing protein [Deltaproteobacteria bacterium]